MTSKISSWSASILVSFIVSNTIHCNNKGGPEIRSIVKEPSASHNGPSAQGSADPLLTQVHEHADEQSCARSCERQGSMRCKDFGTAETTDCKKMCAPIRSAYSETCRAKYDAWMECNARQTSWECSGGIPMPKQVTQCSPLGETLHECVESEKKSRKGTIL